MFTDYNSIAIFIQVARTGSFTRAAEILNLPKSTISKKVTTLETQLRTTLLLRTTRSVQLTDAGKAYFAHCQRAFEEINEAQNQVFSTEQAVSGLLRLTAPAEMCSSLLAPLITEFLTLHPQIDLELHSTDALVDLVTENIHLAIRVGDLEDSTLRAKKIGHSHFHLYASPTYLKARGTPKHPKDLTDHRCIHFLRTSGTPTWVLRNGSKKESVAALGRISSNQLSTLKAMTCEGHGITLLPNFSCIEEEKSGRLVHLLKDWTSENEPIHLVWPQQRFQQAKTKALIRFFEQKLPKYLV